ncbi:MAG: phosphoglycerate kinase, partial [Patescibacteria group bacterium]
MKLRTLNDLDLKGKRVIFRVAYDVPLKKQGSGFAVADDTRIRATLKTLRYLCRKKCRVIVVTWLGRPGGKIDPGLRLDPVARCLSLLVKKPVKKLDAIIGPVVDRELAKMKPGDIVMLENVRFSPWEEHHDQRLADELAKRADAVVFEAFPQSHRDFPSTTGLLARLPSASGFDMVQEATTLSEILEKPTYPFVVILGGAKISDKIDLIKNLIHRADALLIGGALSHNFLKARGIKIGASLIEGRALELKKERKKLFAIAEEIMKEVGHAHVNLGPGLSIPKIVLPLDLVASSDEHATKNTRIINLDDHALIPWNWMYMDIGPRTRALYARVVKKAKMVFWNGPLGYIEEPVFAQGSIDVARAIGESKARSIAGGGDTEGFLRTYRLRSKFDYISTGGGAVLELLSGKELPVIPFL